MFLAPFVVPVFPLEKTMRRPFTLLLCLAAVCVSTAASADVDLVVRPVVRERRERITESPHTFTVKVDPGAMRTFRRFSVSARNASER